MIIDSLLESWNKTQGNEYRYDDDEVVKHKDGSKYWYRNGHLHRNNGPAVELASGSKFWYVHGLLHRESGPAVEFASGNKEWWIRGNRTSIVQGEYKNEIF